MLAPMFEHPLWHPFVTVTCLGWIAMYGYATWKIVHLPRLDAAYAFSAARAVSIPEPRVSIIVAARNEVRALAATVARLRALDYPDLEIILVDDRSEDGTSELVDLLAAEDPGTRAVHIRELPPGWTGKVHAVHQGVQHATGEWLLFTDADVHLRDDTLKRSVAVATHHRLDHLTLGPDFVGLSVPQTAMLTALSILFMSGARIPRPDDNDPRAVLGIGAFNLVRRTTFDRTPGFEWLRMELLDDMGLALMLRRAGGRSAYYVGGDAVQLRWYDSLSDMVSGFEKSVYPLLCGTRPWVALVLVSALVLFAVGPIAGLPSFPHPFVTPALVCAWAAMLAAVLSLHRTFGQPVLPMLLVPFGQIMLAIVILRAHRQARRNGGISWRGNLYRIEDLRLGQRVGREP